MNGKATINGHVLEWTLTRDHRGLEPEWVLTVVRDDGLTATRRYRLEFADVAPRVGRLVNLMAQMA